MLTLFTNYCIWRGKFGILFRWFSLITASQFTSRYEKNCVRWSFHSQLDCSSDFTYMHKGPKFIHNLVVHRMSKMISLTGPYLEYDCRRTNQDHWNITRIVQQKLQYSKMAFIPHYHNRQSSRRQPKHGDVNQWTIGEIYLLKHAKRKTWRERQTAPRFDIKRMQVSNPGWLT